MALAVTAFRQQNEFIDILLVAQDKASDVLGKGELIGEARRGRYCISIYSIRHTRMMMLLLLMGMLRSVLPVTMCSKT